MKEWTATFEGNSILYYNCNAYKLWLYVDIDLWMNYAYWKRLFVFYFEEEMKIIKFNIIKLSEY